MVRELVAAAASLCKLAERGRRVPEYDDQAIRELIVRKYRLIYRVDPEVVFILGVVHGARELPPQ